VPRKYAHTGNDISIGTGVTWPISLNIKGETLGHVHYGVHFLERPEVYKLGESMIASGDVVRGAKTVVEAVETSKRVAYAMDEYLRSLEST